MLGQQEGFTILCLSFSFLKREREDTREGAHEPAGAPFLLEKRKGPAQAPSNSSFSFYLEIKRKEEI